MASPFTENNGYLAPRRGYLSNWDTLMQKLAAMKASLPEASGIGNLMGRPPPGQVSPGALVPRPQTPPMPAQQQQPMPLAPGAMPNPNPGLVPQRPMSPMPQSPQSFPPPQAALPPWKTEILRHLGAHPYNEPPHRHQALFEDNTYKDFGSLFGMGQGAGVAD